MCPKRRKRGRYIMNKTYDINNIYACIQGEGVQTGVPMVLVRFQGCAVGCAFCDTKETWHFSNEQYLRDIDTAFSDITPYFSRLSINDILLYITNNFDGLKWILLTGGEPATWELKPLVKYLHEAGYKVAIETSGTAIGHIGANIDHVSVSPKINMPGGETIKSQSLRNINELKFVIGKRGDLQIVETFLTDYEIKESETTICLQPMSQNRKATDICITECQKRGWRLSLQIHKYLNLP